MVCRSWYLGRSLVVAVLLALFCNGWLPKIVVGHCLALHWSEGVPPLWSDLAKGSVVQCKRFSAMHWLHWRALECWATNGSGNTSAAFLYQLLSTHINSVSSLQSLAITRRTHITLGPGDTMKLAGLTQQSHTMAAIAPLVARTAQSDRFLPVRQSLSPLPQPTSSHVLFVWAGFPRPAA